MALATRKTCAHWFLIIKSDNTLIQWMCNGCYAGPFWCIWECQWCKSHACRTCVDMWGRRY
ncbi:hypothetical protein C8A05DRAFT_19306 [Staphylotrichum tortipilum]|uniref:Uncharacterized protein n=1 Tax=Staphylotrichum tortipilum TaxID=2831512 RepID=A0AAN6MC62_9PEZI|nr:hypothetical protein C8A05DRAFT_19306 [Staphylotrichum longicolle]